MRNLRSFITSRLGLLMFALMITGAALASSPAPAGAAPNCCGHATIVTYYNNAAHSMVVGHCSFPCDQDPVCSGTQTQFSTTKQLGCCIC
jgi:hypothetical protein